MAPMMDYTNRHFRFLFRLLSREATLYTEMITANAVVEGSGRLRAAHDDRLRQFFEFDDCAGKTVLQLGGASPMQLASAAKLAADFGYAAVNLNCGCPSERVAGAGCFGASLMREPELIADCCRALAQSGLPVTVKCRVGAVATMQQLDEPVDYDHLYRLVDLAGTTAGVRRFQVHARVAVLSGLSPDANRKVPPLRPDIVSRLVADFPSLEFIYNGEVNSFDVVRRKLEDYHGVMVGRDAYKRPWYWASLDRDVYGLDSLPAISRRKVLNAYAEYAAHVEVNAHRLGYSPRRVLLKPVLNLFHGDPGSNAFKRKIDALAKGTPTLDIRSLLDEASRSVPDDVLDAPPTTHIGHGNEESPFTFPSALRGAVLSEKQSACAQ